MFSTDSKQCLVPFSYPKIFKPVLFSTLLYVRNKFARHHASGIYYIPLPAKKMLPKILTQICLPKMAQNCTACTANQTKLPKMNFKRTYGTLKGLNVHIITLLLHNRRLADKKCFDKNRLCFNLLQNISAAT